MIDRSARRAFAQALRYLAIGRITNREFERRVKPILPSRDMAIRTLYWSGAWQLYSDFREMRLAGRHALPRAARRDIARWILFLRTPRPFEWPDDRPWVVLAWAPVHIMTFGASAKIRSLRYRRPGDFSVWPFLRRQDYQMALQRPVYLAGMR